MDQLESRAVAARLECVRDLVVILGPIGPPTVHSLDTSLPNMYLLMIAGSVSASHTRFALAAIVTSAVAMVCMDI